MSAGASFVAALGALSAFCIGFSLIPGRNPLLDRLSRMERIDSRNPFKRFEGLEQLLKAESRSRLRDRLLSAGWYRLSPSGAILRGGAGLFAGAGLGLVFLAALPNKQLALGLAVLLALFGWRFPKIMLDRAIARRKKHIARELPDFLDLLATTVRAGLALNLALIEVAESLMGPLRDELRFTLSEIRLGRSRADALRAMAARVDEPQTKTMVATLVQAESLGANIADVLRELSDDTRNLRWLLAEERAARLPVKMIFPMALLMLPALYLVIFGPVIARYAATH